MTKPGECGTCHWFDANPQAQPIGDYPVGICSVCPPVLGQGMQEVPGSRLSPHGPQMVPVQMGFRPPTAANGRCEKWAPAGSHPFKY